MRLSGAAIFSLGLAAVAGYAVYAALAWPQKAALFPLTMGIPLLALAAAQTVIDLRDPPRPAESAGDRRRVLAVFAWMVAFIALVLLVGFPVAVPLFVFAYLMLQSRAGWGMSIAITAVAWGFFYLVFVRLLHFPFEAGLIAIGG